MCAERSPQIVGKKRRLALACGLAPVLFILTAACWPSGLELVVRPRAGGQVLLAVPLDRWNLTVQEMRHFPRMGREDGGTPA